MKINFINTSLLKKMASLGITLVMLGAPQLVKGEEQHVVKKGDTLTGISSRYYGTITLYDELARYNNIENPNMIRVGQIINIPDRKYLYDIIDYYEVKKGDTLWKIAREYYNNNSYWKELGEYNGITNQYTLKIGTILTIPNKWILDEYRNKYEDDIQINNGMTTYIFKGNDTLWGICSKYYGDGMYAYALARYNGIENVRNIQNNTVILLPSIDVLSNYMNNNNEYYGNSLDQISYKYYGTKEYSYLLALINGVEVCGPYHEEELIIPKKDYLDNYMIILNNLEDGDNLSNYYVVQKGDTLSKISLMKYGTVEYADFLKSINEIENTRNIQVNMVLYTPKLYNNKKLVK